MTDETTDSAETASATGAVVDAAETGQPRLRRRLRLLASVAAVVLVLDVVTKVLAVALLTPNQPVSIIGDTVTWTLVRNPGAAFSIFFFYYWVMTVI